MENILKKCAINISTSIEIRKSGFFASKMDIDDYIKRSDEECEAKKYYTGKYLNRILFIAEYREAKSDMGKALFGSGLRPLPNDCRLQIKVFKSEYLFILVSYILAIDYVEMMHKPWRIFSLDFEESEFQEQVQLLLKFKRTKFLTPGHMGEYYFLLDMKKYRTARDKLFNTTESALDVNDESHQI